MPHNNKENKRLYLIDGYAMLYRAHFAMIRNPLINSKGMHTSALFGFVNQIMKLINNEKPDLMIAAFDSPQKTFRHERYPEYKKINLKGEQKFKYTKEWKVKEDLVDSKFFKNNEKTIIPTINQINLSDILIIKNWISYAKLINDETYKEILSQEIDTGYFNEKIIDQISFRTNN